MAEEEKNNDKAAEDLKGMVVEEKEEEKKLTKLDILKKFSSGTGLREALDDIVQGNRGALIVIANKNSGNVFQGGFRINAKFTSKRLVELAKMDGAIILSDDFKKILFSNTLLTPDRTITTLETGTRHQAAERTAKQISGLVIAVSERKQQITIYYGNSKYVLQNTEELLRRATETLQILEKQREVFNELLNNLDVLEVTNLVSVADVCRILERLEVIRKMANVINEYIVELGREGIIVRMRIREITRGIEKRQEEIIKDYHPRPARVRQFFESLSFDKLLDLETMAKVLFGTALESAIIPKGNRMLSKTNLSKEEINNLIRYLKNLEGVLNAEEQSLERVFKGDAKELQKELSNLREQVIVGKKL
jgi:diadenylate cyclase